MPNGSRNSYPRLHSTTWTINPHRPGQLPTWAVASGVAPHPAQQTSRRTGDESAARKASRGPTTKERKRWLLHQGPRRRIKEAAHEKTWPPSALPEGNDICVFHTYIASVTQMTYIAHTLGLHGLCMVFGGPHAVAHERTSCVSSGRGSPSSARLVGVGAWQWRRSATRTSAPDSCRMGPRLSTNSPAVGRGRRQGSRQRHK